MTDVDFYPDDNTLYSFDPGKITGIAKGDTFGNLHELVQLNEEGLYNYLTGIKAADAFIVENFTIYPNKASSFIWSDMQVIQLLGAIKYRAHVLGAELIIQQPNFKGSGYRWAGITPPKNHAISHQTDAYAHLVYYWVQKLKLEPPVMNKLRAENFKNK
jgi:hypothetical protein